MKICSDCKIQKEIHLFYKNNATKDKLTIYCISCSKNRASKYSRTQAGRLSHRRRNLKYKKSEKGQAFWKGNNSNGSYSSRYIKDRCKKDVNFKIRITLRARLNSCVRGKTKTGSPVRDLGCSVPEFREHIEKQFLDGMTWENHGKWHFDHIVPLASFNLQERNEFLRACHFSNIQPLWAFDNMSKGCKIS